MQIALVHMPGHGLDVHFECVSKFGLVEIGPAGEGLSDALRDFVHGRFYFVSRGVFSFENGYLWLRE
jgi:hypothetical protein